MTRESDGSSFYAKHIAYSPDGTQVASSGRDGNVRLWDAVTAEPKGTLNVGANITLALHWFHDSRRLAVASQNGPMVSVWDITRPEGPLARTPNGSSFGLAISPDERQIVFAPDRQIHTLHLETGQIRRLDSGHRHHFQRSSDCTGGCGLSRE